MNVDLFQKMSARVTTAEKIIKAHLLALLQTFAPEARDQYPIQKNRIASETGRALNVGLRHRLTSGHAPPFLLFTYFGDRQ